MKMRKRGAFLLTAALAAFCFTGCNNGGEPEIIGEKQESTAHGQDDAANTPEEKKEGTVREQVQAPDRYQTEIEEQGMVLSADAPVTVPDVETAVPGTSHSLNSTEEEYFQVKKALTDLVEIQWEEDQIESVQSYDEETEEPKETIGTNTTAVGVNASGDQYNISSYQLSGETTRFTTSIIWLNRRLDDGRSAVGPTEISEIGEDMGQPAGKEMEWQEKAEELLQAAGYGDYLLYQGRWRRSNYELGDKSWSETEYWMTFTPTVEGIVCANAREGLLGSSRRKAAGVYIDISFREDGILNQFQIIGNEEIQERNTSETFLLPFEAIHQLFEQHCRDFISTESDKRRALQESLAREGYSTARARINVDNVKLEYIFMLPDDDTTKELELIPVWNFYGTIEGNPQAPDAEADTTTYIATRPNPESHLLSIRADDGQILAD